MGEVDVERVREFVELIDDLEMNAMQLQAAARDALRWALKYGRPLSIPVHGDCNGSDCAKCQEWLDRHNVWLALRDAVGGSDDPT